MKKTMLFMLILCLGLQVLQAKPIFAKDHVLHFTGSAFLTFWNYEFSGDFYNYNHSEQLFYSVNLTALLGVAKETSDKYIKKTKFSWKDITANMLGIAFGVVIIESTR